MFIRNRGLLAPLFVLCVLTHGVLSQDNPCTARDGGKYYDLSKLKSSKDAQITTDTGQMIYFNVCQNVRTEMFGLKDDIQESDVGGFIQHAHGDFVLGVVNTTLTVRDSRLRMILSGGSYCKARADHTIPGETRASALVEFTCDKSIFGSGQPRLVAQLPPGDDEIACAWVIEWRTHFACPVSEGKVLGFFVILAVISLALLMTYAVLGTLYNRYVLQLHGVDQIPQFSIESMRYHGSEAWDWIKDIISGINIGGHGSGGTPYGGRPSRLPSGSPRMPNPVSHHSQNSGSGPPDDLEENGGLDKSSINGGFIRPHQSKNRASPFQRLETNPVSHQSQVIAESLSFPAASPPPSQPQHPHDSPPQGHLLATDKRGSTKEERDFILGDDEEAEELVDVSSHTPTPRASPPSETSSNADTTASSADVAAAARGRDLGGGDQIRL